MKGLPKMTKKKFIKTNPDAYEICWWNVNERNTPCSQAEFLAAKPNADNIHWWNENPRNKRITK
jgi:hypothetical protein